ncbi:MAG: aldehyde dehydrogenase family protein, partial [Planctomycetota bacterium]
MIPAFSARSYEFKTFVPARNFIAGEWRDPLTSKATLPVMNPRFGKPISQVVMSAADDVAAAVEAGSAAFRSWRKWPVRDRAQVFHKLRELMHANLAELSWLVSHENGKLYSEAEAE